MDAPPIEQGDPKPGSQGGFIVHKFIGENEHPLLKIEDFDKTLRAGLGDQVDVAMMKFCYLDIAADTDVEAIFDRYRDTVAALRRDYPNVTFVHVTVPLMTDSTVSRLKSQVKVLLGKSDRSGPAANVARERYNELLRNEYGNDHLFDLAAVESTSPNGDRQQFSYKGSVYYALDDRNASDNGHLNAEGSEIAASAFLQAIADASPK